MQIFTLKVNFSHSTASHMLGQIGKKIEMFYDNFNSTTERKRLSLPVRMCFSAESDCFLYQKTAETLSVVCKDTEE